MFILRRGEPTLTIIRTGLSGEPLPLYITLTGQLNTGGFTMYTAPRPPQDLSGISICTMSTATSIRITIFGIIR